MARAAQHSRYMAEQPQGMVSLGPLLQQQGRSFQGHSGGADNLGWCCASEPLSPRNPGAMGESANNMLSCGAAVRKLRKRGTHLLLRAASAVHGAKGCRALQRPAWRDECLGCFALQGPAAAGGRSRAAVASTSHTSGRAAATSPSHADASRAIRASPSHTSCWALGRSPSHVGASSRAARCSTSHGCRCWHGQLTLLKAGAGKAAREKQHAGHTGGKKNPQESRPEG